MITNIDTSFYSPIELILTRIQNLLKDNLKEKWKFKSIKIRNRSDMAKNLVKGVMFPAIGIFCPSDSFTNSNTARTVRKMVTIQIIIWHEYLYQDKQYVGTQSIYRLTDFIYQTIVKDKKLVGNSDGFGTVEAAADGIEVPFSANYSEITTEAVDAFGSKILESLLLFRWFTFFDWSGVENSQENFNASPKIRIPENKISFG